MASDSSSKGPERPAGRDHTDTRLVHAGRDPRDHYGFVNTPLYRGSTVLFPDMATLETGDQPFRYGRRGTPTSRALETALSELEGGDRTFLTPSGLCAITTSVLAFVRAGDHILVTDSVYSPTRHFCDTVLARLGVETTYYDPLVGAGIAGLLRPNTRLAFLESPGSQTFEIQDVPAIARACRAANCRVLLDNTWGTQLYFKPFDHGVDVAIHAGTKYVVGHSDAMLGAITAKGDVCEPLARCWGALGAAAGSEEIFLGLRGLRTMHVRLGHHQASALDIARWLASRPEVARVLHPALEDHPGHAIWRRDFLGASGLFSVILKPASKTQVAAMLDGLRLFGMGYSWGGFESLVIPFDPTSYRTATRWQAEGPALRFHIGLEDVGDLKADLAAGFDRLKNAG